MQRRITAVLFLRTALSWLAVAWVAFGVAALVARGLGAPRDVLVWASAIVPLALIGAAVHTRRLAPREDQVVALVDAHAGCGGLLMASRDIPLGAWSVDVRDVPRVGWKAGRHVAMAALSLAFAAAVALAPARASETKQLLDVRRDVDQLQKRVDLLREEEILPDKRAELLEKTLDDLRREAAAEDPARAWETLDSIDEMTAQAAREAGDEAVKRAEQLTRVEALSAAAHGEGVDPSSIAEATKDMAADLEAAELPPDLQDALAKNALTKEQMKELGDAARAGKNALRKTLDKLRQSALIDPKTLRQFEDAASLGNRDELARFLRKNASRTTLSNAIGQWCEGGRPGVSRGRGDAPMFFGEKSEGGEFEEQTLPPAAQAMLNQSEIIAVSAAAPGDADSQRSAGGALGGAQVGAGSAHTPVVLPRHRGTVQRFFERKQK